ncbi:MAG TPA: diaminopimelate dehydrogenase [Firmicutes bacterium]|jgi:diaminopimelate dehydrogenase|nr:diaminopimelate dehydrogenase [Bacillota bacterium]
MGISIGIMGYGNLGRGVEQAVEQNPDMNLVAVFTRRNPESLRISNKQARVLHMDMAGEFIDGIDVMILCGGSATDLPLQGPCFARLFNTVDSYDTHARIPGYFAAVDKSARTGGKTSAISIGWDPGLFSLNRLLGEAVLPRGHEYTFWGRGISQGHSEAIRRVKGVKNAVQYTVPLEDALKRIKKGETPDLTTKERHLRECYVVAGEGADLEGITRAIKTMPDYFAGYETKVIFISEEEFTRDHSNIPHGGFVIRSGQTGQNGAGNKQIMEFSIKLESNPQFTASILTAYARAVYRLNNEGQIGAKTIFDIPPAYLSARSPGELRRTLL